MNAERSERLPDLLAEALARPPQDQEAYLAAACADDPALCAEALSLLAGQEEARTFLEKPAYDLLDAQNLSPEEGRLKPGDRLGDCTVIRLVGEGGMGEVYLAEDTRLERRVALKLLKRHLNEVVDQRFRHERRVLAGLTHPGIARLYNAAVADGCAYFVMEYVEGERLDTYCEKRHLSIDERLTLFRQVCAAVAYAHQNLVIHRDLKPANIRVTPEGEPKLLDFGIAKLVDPEIDADTAQTVTMYGAMTPGYASPEQLRGEAVTTATDIYSLGVVLYELLSGRRPFDGKGLRDAAHTAPRPSSVAPGRVARRLTGDLDNIVLMAMRPEPLRRYPSVSQFSEDIRRHLEGQPVSARQETLGYVGAKFVARHKALTAAATIVLITLVGGIVTTTWEADRAEEQRQRADRRFNDVRRLADSLMGEIHDSVQNLAGSTPTRKLIVARAIEYLDNLSKEADTPELRGDLAAAYEKIGNVQGNPYEANLGDTDGALASYRKAESLLRSVAGSGAASPAIEVQMALGRIERALGDIHEVQGNYAEMIRSYRQSLEVFALLARAKPSDPAVIDELARADDTLGDGLERTENYQAEQLGCYEQALAYRQKLLEQAPGNNKYRRGLAVVSMKLGEAYLPDKKRAVDGVARAVALFKTLSDENPDNVRARRDYALSLYTLGWTLGEVGDHAGSLANHRQALAIREQIAAADPKDQQAQYDLAVANGNLAEALLDTSRPEDALEHARQAAASLEAMMAVDPANTTYRRNGALFCEKVGNAQAALAANASLDASVRLDHWVEAQAGYEKARQLFSDLKAKGALRSTDADKPASLTAKIAKCHEAIAQLKTKPLAAEKKQ